MLPTIFRYNNFLNIGLFCIAICLLLYLYPASKVSELKYRKLAKLEETYFIKTKGCKVLATHIDSAEIQKYIKRFPPIECERRTIFRAITIDGKNYLQRKINKSKMQNIYNLHNLTEISCIYRDVERVDDNTNHLGKIVAFNLSTESDLVEVQSEADVILVKCYKSKNVSIDKDVHFFIKPPKVEKTVQAPKEKRQLSIMILGLDSLSHLNFLRQMKRTKAYINKKLAHIEFWGYNRLGRNTYPNLIPMLTGLSVKQFEQQKKTNKMHYYDNCSFIWKQYKNAGYNTSFGEDNEYMTLFNYFHPGFKRQPMDYYLRTVFLELRKTNAYISNYDQIHCFGDRNDIQILFEFIEKLVPHLATHPFFSIFWWAVGLHSYLNFPQVMDKQIKLLLQNLNENGVLERTMLFFISDHGIRYGAYRQTYQGMMEASQPLFYIIYPPWLKQNYPHAIRNLHNNAKKLVTAYDVHATLKDLLNLENLQKKSIVKRSIQLDHLQFKPQHIPYGISLFLPIPDNRNCISAGIPEHYCLCSSYKELNLTDVRVQAAAHFAMEYINEKISPHPMCLQLALQTTLKAYIKHNDNLIANSEFYVQQRDRMDKNPLYNIRVAFQTLPRDVIFEATLQFNGETFALSGEISRLTNYTKQTCLENTNDFSRLVHICECQ